MSEKKSPLQALNVPLLQPSAAEMTAQAKIFKALGHPSRLAMVSALQNGALCVAELQNICHADMSTVSRHLAVLREAGIVEATKSGTSVYYALRLTCLSTFLHCTGKFVHETLQKAQAGFRIDA